MSVSPKRAEDLTRELEARVPMNDLRERSPAAVTELVRLLAAPLHRFAARLTGSDADAEDVVQTVFARALEAAGRFDGSHADLRAWFFTVAYRAGIDVLRARRRTVALEDGPAGEPADDRPPADLETTPSELRRAMQSLPERDQAVLTLKYQDDFSNAEIGRILGIEPNHVGVLLYRAKRNLRRFLP